MKITFRIHYNTKWGENLFVSGSHDELGNWDTKNALPMIHQGAGEWEATVEMVPEKSFEYKYFIQFGMNVPLWEGCHNRKMEAFNYAFIEIRDHWRMQADTDEIMLSKVFSNVIMKPLDFDKKVKEGRSKQRIRFNICIPRVMPGNKVAIIGNQNALGDWIKPVVMQNVNFPIWSIELDLAKLTFPIVYKYVIIDKATKMVTQWENDNARQIFFINKSTTNFLHIQNDDKFRHPLNLWKGAGVAVPVFSLRSTESFGVGEFNDLKKLADWAVLAGIKMIQVLPINETVATHSWLDSYPYKAISVIALHPMYLNLQQLGILNDERLKDEFEILQEVLNAKTYVDYVEVTRLKSKYYKLIFDQEWKKTKNSKEFKEFYANNQEWLEPYAAFCFLRDRYKTSDFRQWGIWSEYNRERIEKIVNPKSKHHEHIAVHYFIQFHLDKQLREAVDYAHSKGITLKGDIPIGISPNSVEAWTDPELFNLNGQAGAPPDDFAVLGQNWGFPTYNWDKMADDGFAWWKKRLSAMEKYFDAYRIDHILGFFRIWEIPKHALHGLLGYFKPGIPLTINEIEDWGIWFDSHRFTKPYIRKHMLHNLFGQYTDEVLQLYLTEYEPESYSLNKGYRTQLEIHNHFTPDENGKQQLTDKNVIIRDGLISLLDEVLFIADPYSSTPAYHPRISIHQCTSYMELDFETKSKLDDLYIDFYYRRHNQFWEEEAYHKLPSILKASNMMVCGEDLGMVPDCVPEVMKQLNILSLEIQRMPKNMNIEFENTRDMPYLSVCTTSTHDMSTIRGWWEENLEKTQRYYHSMLGHNDNAPAIAEPWVCRQIIHHHLNSPSIWAIFPIQDIIAMDGDLRWDYTDKERINVPSDSKNKWRYRMILSLEELIQSYEFNQLLKNMVHRSGRLCVE